MSDRFGLKVKENAGKTKYSSLNLNQTYKGTKVETKTSSGTARHGLQSLGKVGASRRIPPPANLPSLKSENSGNDPTVSLVPSGGGGWGSAKEKPSETPPVVTSQAATPSSTPSQTNVPASQQPLLQPQRPIPPPSHPQQEQQPQPQSQNSGHTQTQPVKQQESQAKTWGSVSSNGAGGPGKTYSHQEMPYFNREFPVLGGGNSGDRLPPHMEEKEHPQYGPKPMMRNMHEPAWMERSGPGPPPLDYGPGRERAEVYNGGPGPGYTGGPQYRRPPDHQHGPHTKNYPQGYPHHHGNGPHGHGPGPGRHSHGYPPDYYSRGPVHRPGAGPGPVYASKPPDKGRGEGYGRPAILKPEDIQAMADNDEEEEGGWAGAQDEVDYAAKLDFEDFEDDEKPPPESSREKVDRDGTGGEPDTRWQSNEGRSGKEMGPPPTRPAWAEAQGHPHPYSDSRQVPPGPAMRPFDSRGSPPTLGWPMPYPQHLPAQQRGGGPPVHPPHHVSSDQGKPVPKEGEPVVNEWQKRRVKQQEEMRAAVERARRRREEEELKRQAEQKAAASAKLKELELKRVRRESAKEGDDAWAEELDSIEKDVYNRESGNEQRVPESPDREREPQTVAANQQDGALIRSEVLEHVNRQRNDSESSDASRSSASRGTSRAHHHPPRDIPPRFQQQQLRQQQQQHFQPHYQQQQPYPPQYQYHQQQLARSPQLREFQEGPLSVSSHYPVFDAGPVSPSQPAKPDVPVRRIMKRSDSSSTAGDDIASVKSLESGSGEPTRESEKRPSAAQPDRADKTEVSSEQPKEAASDARKSDSSRTERKPVDDQDAPVFDEANSVGSGDSRQRKQQESDKPQLSESVKEKEVSKERGPDKIERKDSRDGTVKPDMEKTSQTRDRREERRSSKRDTRPQDDRRNEDSKDLGKRKREDSEDAGRFPERRGRFAGRGDSKRERFSESQGHGRASYAVRGHGRGMGSSVTSFRGRGRGERGSRDSRDGRDSRDYREYKPTRSREPKASPPTKRVDAEQKQKEEDKENVAVKESSFKSATDTSEKVEESAVTVKQEKVPESGPLPAEKDVVTQKRENEIAAEEKKEVPLHQENKVGEDEDRSSKLPDKDAEKLRRQDDSRKKSDSYREATNLKPKGRGGFGKPPQYSQDSRSTANQDKRPGARKFTDKRRTFPEGGRDHGDNYDEKRSSRNYSRDQTSQRSTARDNRNWERGREKEQKSHSHHDDRDTGNRRYAQDDRKKRISDKDDDQQYSRQRTDDRNQRGGHRSSYSTRGRFSKPPGRTSARGGRSSQPVGSGRFGNNYRRSKSTDEELSEDDYDSDSSSYTTATSASEERKDEKSSDKESDMKRGKESSSNYDKSRASSRSTRSPIRGKLSSRAGGRGAGGFGRSRREVERPPRFQKQQERERASMARGVSRVDRQGEGRESAPGRGRGRGRGRREQLPKDSSEGPGIPVTEDWDEDLGDTPKEGESSRGDKTGVRRESASRRGFSGPRSSSDRTRKDKGRESGGTRNTSSRREPFLVERQQAKVEGSKSGSGEPRGPLPAARNGFSKDGNRRSDMQSHSHGTGLDSINTGVNENKVSRKQETPLRKTDIQQFDLHNIAGVICIDDMTDDDSDISSTLSGFVEVTSRRTQKENKDRQREEDERRKKADEQNRQRSNQAGNKKNQSSKPPRFSKQHTPQANTQTKPPGVIGKAINTAVSEAVTGIPNTASNSNPSSASSTKRNSPVTVERPVSPPPPVFNAWDKPLIVTPAKPPSATPLVTSLVPDPLAVGSGKPSSTRPTQSGTVPISSAPSLIEDISVDEDYIAMTKEIALLAPPEEPEEIEEPAQPVTHTKPKVENRDQTSDKVAKLTDSSEKRSQPKPQREKPPRFDRTGKRRVAASGDETKREQSGATKGRKNSRDNLASQKLQAKGSGDNTLKANTVASSNAQQQSEEVTLDNLESSKEIQDSEEYDATAAGDMVTTASGEGSEEKDDLKESEEQDVKDDSESESSRKDSEPDLNVDSAERNNDADNLFSTGSLTVDIHERPAAERPVREPSPVSPAIFEMTKKMEASRKLWEGGLGIGRTSNPVAAWEETLRTPASVSSSIVGMPVVESNELRLNDDQVVVSKSQSELEVNSSKSDSKPSDGISFTKKAGSGEQQNVCKVKPQQQQQPPVKPQQSSSVVPQTTEENHPGELNAVPLGQPLLTQEQLLAQQALPQRYAFPFVSQYMDLQQRQPLLQQQQQQLQQLQQTSQQVTPSFPLAHVQQVNQARSSSSPLSQTTQDIYQSSFLAGGVYSGGNFQGTQPFVSIALLPSTTTQSFVTSTSRTQTTSLMGMQAQQPKTASGSVFPQNVTPQGGQTMYMPFDPKTLSGGTPLFNLTQHPQASHRHLLGAQSGIVGENVPRQGGFPTAQPTHQPYQGAYPFQQKQGTFDVSQDMQMKKTPEQTDFGRQSELVKHVNAKPFEPPKRSTPGSVSAGNAPVGPMVSSTFHRNPNLVTIRPSPPDMGGTSQSPPVSTSLISGRPMSMSPVDPGVQFPGAVGTFPKHTAMGQFQVQQQPQGVQPQQFTPFQQQPVGIQHALQIRPQQQQQQAVNPLPGAAATILPNPAVMAAAVPRQLIRTGLGPIGVGGAQPSASNAQRFPAPIQRPMTASLMHGVPHMQAPRGPRPQTTPPQMVPSKQQILSTRPQMPQPSVPHQDPIAAAFKLEQHHKMLEQTRMFFAQQEQQQQQQRVLPPNIPADQQPKAVTSSQGDKPTMKGQVPRETHKLQEKKEEVNPRNRKNNSEQPNKTSKTTKADSKPEESSKDKNITKQDGKGAATKSSSSSSGSLVRIQPLPMPGRNKPNRPRGPPRMPGMPANKAKFSGRVPEKESKDTTAPDQPSESRSPKNPDQAKVSDAQPVLPLSVNKG